MEDTNDSLILALLRPILPAKPSVNVIDWLKAKDFRAVSLDTLTPETLKNMGGDEREALGNVIYDAYCRAKGITRVHAPENLRRALDMLAYKFHFADSAAMYERSERLYSRVKSGLETFAWRDNYLTRQTLNDKDILFAVNTWFKEWREGWTQENKEFFEQCQTEHIKKNWRTYEPGELFETIQEFMQDHAGQEYNYNQVADGLQIAKTPVPGALPQRMKVKDVLEKLSNPKQNIYEDVYKYATRPNVKGKKSATVYVWAPIRRQLDRNPEKRTLIISSVITDFVSANPDCSQSQIKDAVRAALGQSDNTTVIAVLTELIEDKRVQNPRRGPHNTYMYRIAENPFFAVAEVRNGNHSFAVASKADKPHSYDPTDIFGVGV